jgi:DNA-binding response OmpR family regulator
VAVIEDDPNIRALIVRILESGGYTVAATGDPRTALELVRERHPVLVLCDIAMPDLDGYGVLHALQQDAEVAGVPVVFLTAHHEFTERVRAFRFGVVDYLTKPFTPAVLLRKVEKVLETLSLRKGRVAVPDLPAGALLDEVRRESRTGVLTVKGEGGDTRVVLRAGEIVESTGSPAPEASAQFAELDATREDIVAHDPNALPATSTALPTFDDIPPVLRHVLVVDDNPFFRRFLHDLLTTRGFTVQEAASAAEGLGLALQHRPWLILSDVRMPGQDGFTFCEQVRSHSLIRQTPFLFLSGWDDYRARHHGLELGADDFLSKETPVRELLMRMQLVLRRHLDLGRRDTHSGMEGQLQVMGAPGVLQVCHLTRLTGTLTVEAGPQKIMVRFREGEIVDAESPSNLGVEAVYDFLAWDQGRFRFLPGDAGHAASINENFNQLVLEGCRRLDEKGRASDDPTTV